MAFHRGAEARRRTDDEIARQKQKQEDRKKQGSMPFRFYVPVGESKQIIICDDAPDFFMYEHNLKGADGKYKTFTGCVKEDANCPICESQDKESYYAMFLTVIDLSPFETRDGETVDFSRKLLCVKPGQQKKFLRFFEKEGTLRGALFTMTRDGDKDASIGNDIEFEEFVDEKEMATYKRSWVDREKKKHSEVCSDPFVYDELFEEATEESLRAIVGGRPSPGSRAADDRELGRGRPAARGKPAASGRTARGKAAETDDWEEAEDNREYGEPAAKGRVARGRAEPEAPARGSERVTRRSRAEPDADIDPDDADLAEVETRPARGARASRPAAREETRAAPARRGRAEPADEPDDDGPPFDTEPQPRRGARPARDTSEDTRPVRRGRAEPEPEPEPERSPRRTLMRGRR